MTSLNYILNRFKDLKLNTYPIDDIRNLLHAFGKVDVVVITLHEGKTIIRARTNEANHSFSKVSELSYKPAEFNLKFQRASTPLTTMFYGCVVPEKPSKGEFDNARATALFEASKFYRRGIENGEEKITYSRWTVIKDIPLIAIIYHKDFINNSSHTRELYTAFQAYLLKNSSNIIKSNEITELLANEFAKSDTNNEYDYLISALYTELVINMGFAGVYYPSVRAGGLGFNVAIHPYFVNNCMIPIVMGECTAYIKGKNIVVDNDTIAEIEIGQTEFVLKPITDPILHAGKTICIAKLNGVF